MELTNVPWRTVEKEPGTEPGRYATYVHPIVYQRPHLDEKTILINDLQTDHVIGLSPDESEALLQEVFSYLYAPEAVYSHEWEPNDIIIWDNIALQHCRPDNMGTVRRHLRRQSIDGWNLGNGDVMEWHDTAIYDSRIVAQAEG